MSETCPGAGGEPKSTRNALGCAYCGVELRRFVPNGDGGFVVPPHEPHVTPAPPFGAGEREVVVEGLWVWAKVQVDAKVRVRGEPHEAGFEFLDFVEATVTQGVAEVKLGVPGATLDLNGSNDPYDDLQTDIRALEGWDDEAPEEEPEDEEE